MFQKLVQWIRSLFGKIVGTRAQAGECDSLKSALCDAVWDDKKLEDVRLDDGTSDVDSLDAFEYSWSWASKQIVRG